MPRQEARRGKRPGPHIVIRCPADRTGRGRPGRSAPAVCRWTSGRTDTAGGHGQSTSPLSTPTAAGTDGPPEVSPSRHGSLRPAMIGGQVHSRHARRGVRSRGRSRHARSTVRACGCVIPVPFVAVLPGPRRANRLAIVHCDSSIKTMTSKFCGSLGQALQHRVSALEPGQHLVVSLFVPGGPTELHESLSVRQLDIRVIGTAPPPLQQLDGVREQPARFRVISSTPEVLPLIHVRGRRSQRCSMWRSARSRRSFAVRSRTTREDSTSRSDTSICGASTVVASRPTRSRTAPDVSFVALRWRGPGHSRPDGARSRNGARA